VIGEVKDSRWKLSVKRLLRHFAVVLPARVINHGSINDAFRNDHFVTEKNCRFKIKLFCRSIN